MNHSGTSAPVAKFPINRYIIENPVISSVQKLTSPINMFSCTAMIHASRKLSA